MRAKTLQTKFHLITLALNYMDAIIYCSDKSKLFQRGNIPMKVTLREKCPNKELFLVRMSCIRIEYGDLQSKSPYLTRIQENTDQK